MVYIWYKIGLFYYGHSYGFVGAVGASGGGLPVVVDKDMEIW